MKKLIILFIMLAIILSSCAAPNMKGSGKGGMPPVGLAQGNTAPDFSLKNIDGEDVKLSDYRGKIVIVNFFGVWCPWCVREMPGFVKVYNDYKDRGVELLVVDVGDSKQTLLNYLKTNNFSIKPVIDDKQEVSGKYQVNGYPTSYIIDSKGVIQRVHSGYMDEGSLRSILDSIINTH